MPPPPLPPRQPPRTIPRIVVYHQTHYRNNDKDYVPILPLLSEPTGITHLIIAAIHLNDAPGDITLNDHPPDNPLFKRLWSDVQLFQDSGVKVLGMLGGAAKGSFTRLDGDGAKFEEFYVPLRDMLRTYKFDGLDLDVEEPMSLSGVIRLIDRLKADFGEVFIITLAPVAPALQRGSNLSGFDYDALEVARGGKISWYNTQFYCGWGSMEDTQDYDLVMACGWPAHKVVAGVVTNGENGQGWVPTEILQMVIVTLMEKYPGFGGIMGWEYFNSLPGGVEKPWEWANSIEAAVEIGLAITG